MECPPGLGCSARQRYHFVVCRLHLYDSFLFNPSYARRVEPFSSRTMAPLRLYCRRGTQAKNKQKVRLFFSNSNGFFFLEVVRHGATSVPRAPLST